MYLPHSTDVNASATIRNAIACTPDETDSPLLPDGFFRRQMNCVTTCRDHSLPSPSLPGHTKKPFREDWQITQLQVYSKRQTFSAALLTHIFVHSSKSWKCKWPLKPCLTAVLNFITFLTTSTHSQLTTLFLIAPHSPSNYITHYSAWYKQNIIVSFLQTCTVHG